MLLKKLENFTIKNNSFVDSILIYKIVLIVWGNILTDVNYNTNFNLQFPNSKTDILIHLAQWQYWWWFWFSSLWGMYYLFLAKTLRNRTLKFKPKIASTFRPHGKWGDMIICILPLSWCLNILVSSNYLLKVLEWQAESSLFTIRVRGKQWYWVYKFDFRNFTDIISAPRNVGRNKWTYSFCGEIQTSSNYYHLMQLRSQSKFIKKFWGSNLDKFTEESSSNNIALIENYLRGTRKIKQPKQSKRFNFKFPYANINHFSDIKPITSIRNIKNLIPSGNFNSNMNPAINKAILSETSISDLICLQKLVHLEYLNLDPTTSEKIYKTIYERYMISRNIGILADFAKMRLRFYVIMEKMSMDYEAACAKDNSLKPGISDFYKKLKVQNMMESQTVCTSYTLVDFNKLREIAISKDLTKVWTQPQQDLHVFYNNTKIFKKKVSFLKFKSGLSYFQIFDKKQPYSISSCMSREDSFKDIKNQMGKKNPIHLVKNQVYNDTLNIYKDNYMLRFKFHDKNAVLEDKTTTKPLYFCFKQKRYKKRRYITQEYSNYNYKSHKKKSLSFKGNHTLKNNYNIESETAISNKEKNPAAKVNLKMIQDLRKKYNVKTSTEGSTRLHGLIRKSKSRSENLNITLSKRLLRVKKTLVIPTHVNITAITNSYDVVHSWFIPGLGLKMDCVPGRSTHHTFYVDNAGFYYGQCAEICGRYHHHMPIRVCALPFEHFLLWWNNFGLPHLMQTGKKDFIKEYSFRKYSW